MDDPCVPGRGAPGTPMKCPHCGSHRVAPVDDADLEGTPVDADAATAYPGVLECRDCGAIVRWEP